MENNQNYGIKTSLSDLEGKSFELEDNRIYKIKDRRFYGPKLDNPENILLPLYVGETPSEMNRNELEIRRQLSLEILSKYGSELCKHVTLDIQKLLNDNKFLEISGNLEEILNQEPEIEDFPTKTREEVLFDSHNNGVAETLKNPNGGGYLVMAYITNQGNASIISPTKKIKRVF